jgi:hypothetical protein
MKQAIIVIVSLLLCWFWYGLWLAGSPADGNFYAYPITRAQVMIWAVGWTLILGVAYLLCRQKKK